MDDLIRMTAREVLARLNAGDITHSEVLDALEARVAAVDGAVNALPTLCFDRARDHAARIAAPEFYRVVGQNLRSWSAPAPKVKVDTSHDDVAEQNPAEPSVED